MVSKGVIGCTQEAMLCPIPGLLGAFGRVWMPAHILFLLRLIHLHPSAPHGSVFLIPNSLAMQDDAMHP